MTTPERSEAAIEAARAIQSLMERSPGDAGRQTLLREAVAAFKDGNFAKGHAIATGQER